MERETGFRAAYSPGRQAADDAFRREYHLPEETPVTAAMRAESKKDQKTARRLAAAAGVLFVLTLGAGLALLLTAEQQAACWMGAGLGGVGLTGMITMPWTYRQIMQRQHRRTERKLGSAVGK